MRSLAKKRLLLVGAPASGKSSVGTLLKELLEDCQHLDLDTEIRALCTQRQLTGPLSDAVIDEAVEGLFRRVSNDSLLVELPHHDYITLHSSGAVRFGSFDCVVVLSADFAVLTERDEARAYHVPLSYIARCLGSIESLCCLLPQLDVPWLRLNTHGIKPEHVCQCVIDFLRRNASSTLEQLLIAPAPDRAYLGGHFRAGVEWDDELIRLLMERAAIRTALDVGCGNGESLQNFAALGICAWGLEGYPNLDGVGHRVFQVDFTKQWIQWPTRPDLVWCIEVLEHVPSVYEHNVIRTIAANTGTLAFVTAAPPGQPGYHHVNCQPQSYWIERLQNAGLRYVPETPSLLSRLSDTGPFGMNVFKNNGMLFEVSP